MQLSILVLHEFSLIHAFQDIPQVPNFISSEIHSVVFKLLYHSQLTIREHAAKALSTYISCCDVQVRIERECERERECKRLSYLLNILVTPNINVHYTHVLDAISVLVINKHLDIISKKCISGSLFNFWTSDSAAVKRIFGSDRYFWHCAVNCKSSVPLKSMWCETYFIVRFLAHLSWKLSELFWSPFVRGLSVRFVKPISTKLGTKHSWVKGFKFVQMKGYTFFSGEIITK